MCRKMILVHSLLLLIFAAPLIAAEPVIRIETPMSPPAWALLEREVLKDNEAACEEFYKKYFDERGFLLGVERWGGNDGPDDAIESCNEWPLLYAMGASERVRQMYEHAWEGHLRQYTLAKTTEVPFAKDGMFYKEFHTMMDWMHITASVFINDNESGLHHDYEVWLEQLAPFNPSGDRYHHNRTGEDNADAHLKRQVMGREVVVAITGGKLHLGPWEHIFYYEFDGNRAKRVLVKMIGE